MTRHTDHRRREEDGEGKERRVESMSGKGRGREWKDIRQERRTEKERE